MDLYTLFKFLHVASAIVWIGAGVGLVVLGIAADAKNDRAEFGRIIQNVVFMAPRIFIPSSVVVLVFGLIMAFMSWGFAHLWIDLGLIGWAITFCTGNFLLKPRADRVSEMIAKEGISDGVVAVGHELLQIAKFDYVMLFVVVASMVFKPVVGDWFVLLLMALAIAAGGLFFLGPVLQPRRVTA